MSNCGTWIQNLGQIILVYRLTHSTFLVGAVTFFQFIAFVVLSPWTGTAVDRFNRRHLVILTQVVGAAAALTLGVLSSAGSASVGAVLAVALVIGLANSFAVPALQAIVPELVDRSEMRPAVALNSSTFSIGRALGPVIAAALLDNGVSISAVFLLNSLSYLALIGALLVSRPIRVTEPPKQHPKGLRVAIDLVRKDRELLVLLITIGAIAIAMDPILTLAPAFSVEIFSESDSFAADLAGAFGAGGIAGALLATRRSEVTDRGIVLALLAMVATVAAFALSPHWVVGLVAVFGSGLFFSTTNALATTRLQLQTPHELRGRMMALWAIAFLGVRPIAGLTDGALASVTGVRIAAISMTIPAAVAAIMMIRGRIRADEPA